MAHRVLLCVSGGIAAYKTPDLVRKLIGAGHEVQVVMTRAAESFVTEMSLATVSRRPVRRALFDVDAEVAPGERMGVGHIELADWATVVLAAPATAHLLARAAHGLADDLATTILLATRAPVLFAPAMNSNMWAHPAVSANIECLRSRGARFIGPAVGELACGYEGEGRMSEPDVIVEALGMAVSTTAPISGVKVDSRRMATESPTRTTAQAGAHGVHVEVRGSEPDHVDTGHATVKRKAPDSASLAEQAEAIATLTDETELSGLQPKPQPWAGRHVLVSAGPTRAYIDPVRFISNASTGSMGFELARAARDLGARVTLVTGPVELDAPTDLARIDVETGAQMLEAMGRTLASEDVDLVAMVAAVADLIPDRPSETKIAKHEMADSLGQMAWRNEVDVLATLVERHASDAKFLGFAAQTVDSDVSAEIEAELLRYGAEKLDRKKTDALFVNRVGVQGTGFASSTNAGFLMIRSGREPGEMDEIINSGAPVAKSHLAHWILNQLDERLFSGEGAEGKAAIDPETVREGQAVV